MKSRILGKNGFNVTEVGLGCWQLGGKNWGDDMNNDRAFEILQAAVDSGIRFFDTADEYGEGQSESLIGAFLKTTDADIKVATKFGKSVKVGNNFNEAILRESIEASAERLGVKTLDLLQLHCVPQDVLEDGAIFDWLRRLQREDKIAHFGASVESIEEALICMEQDGLQSLQVIYNIFRQKLTKQLLPQAQSKGVGIIVRLPLASGLLTGKFNKNTKFAENDHRNFNQGGKFFNAGETFSGLFFDKGLELSEHLKTLCPPELTMAQMALRWILDHKAVSTVIPGASSTSQVIGNATASTLDPLPNDLMKTLETFYVNEVHEHIHGVY
ncbi:aldo/keto reductase [Flagellimonas sp. CMM7]|uniref:aldo/keto reductase n=1 Tax=Flagellimonas sp. CMM7 TaxID=2654676 RepID=UPI0013D1A982|nr:aldo/keto reductase [Flagellimonas sp. CMM7]UII79859.1 aldo/keto reductase [Flagellimonas sp. CMM7]